MGSIISEGTIVGNNSVVAAGSVVEQSSFIPPRQVSLAFFLIFLDHMEDFKINNLKIVQLWGGSPAAFIRELTDEELNSGEKLVQDTYNLAKKHEQEHMKTAEERLTDYEDNTFFVDIYFKPKY
jgi:carbonic anhydrase/acetyltransferase-like protein (isoleucine patch superfamily)